ncbi:MAG: hypothetical protein NDI82_12370 [Anaeromyxobacteraceae bacterium]|nr:hypothetical protein [Anaeromyxobacteraceae bacterium]
MRYQLIEEKVEGEWVPSEVLMEGPDGLRVYKPMGRINIHPVRGVRLEDFDLNTWALDDEEMRLGPILSSSNDADPHDLLRKATAGAT